MLLIIVVVSSELEKFERSISSIENVVEESSSSESRDSVDVARADKVRKRETYG